MIDIQHLSKVFSLESGDFVALNDINLRIQPGEFVAIMGPSGSGKSTLLQLIGGLDLPTSGDITVDGTVLNRLNEKERTLFRRKNVGFVFQNYQLLPMMTAAENVGLPLAAHGVPKGEMQAIVQRLLSAVHLEEMATRLPGQLSGGQQQRVAIARALAMKPKLILADEPTGNLDWKTGMNILQLLSRLSKEENITIVMVTHDRQAAAVADRILLMRDGAVVEDGFKEVGLHEPVSHGMA
jgi:putative ABC transport system ATP-binding protein